MVDSPHLCFKPVIFRLERLELKLHDFGWDNRFAHEADTGVAVWDSGNSGHRVKEKKAKKRFIT